MESVSIQISSGLTDSKQTQTLIKRLSRLGVGGCYLCLSEPLAPVGRGTEVEPAPTTYVYIFIFIFHIQTAQSVGGGVAVDP